MGMEYKVADGVHSTANITRVSRPKTIRTARKDQASAG